MDSDRQYEERVQQSTEAGGAEQAAEERPGRRRRRLIVLAVSALLIALGNGAGFIAAVLAAKHTGRLWFSLILMLVIVALAFALMLFIIKKILINNIKSD